MKGNKDDLMRKMLIASFFTGKSEDHEEKMEVLIPVEVSVKWVAFMKSLCVGLNVDFPPTLEALLHEFFVIGMEVAFKELKEEYDAPADIFKDFLSAL